MNARNRLIALIVFLAGTALTAGQTPTPQPPQSQQPTFKVQVDYVEVDIVVVLAERVVPWVRHV